MLDSRLIAVLLIAGGISSGALSWSLVGSGETDKQVSSLEEGMGKGPPGPRTLAGATGSADASLSQKPFLLLTVGPNAVTEPSISLIGVAISPKRRQALVSFDNKEPEWVGVGDAREQIKINGIDASGVEIESELGIRRVGFNDPRPAAAPGTAPIQGVPSPSKPSPAPTPLNAGAKS